MDAQDRLTPAVEGAHGEGSGVNNQGWGHGNPRDEMFQRSRADRLLAATFAAPCPVYEFRSARSDPADHDLRPMRAVAVAADGGGVEVTPSVVTGIATVIGGGFGAVALWLAQRLVGKAAWQQAMNAQFQILMERAEKLHAEERQVWHAERLQLRGEIVNLRQTVMSLTSRLRKAGVLDIPEDRFGIDPLVVVAPEDQE